ncbi:developmental pluripotency-associated 5 protein isoform X1 [Oryctolagus cuniculus]|uniref:Embryonal stem cell-specific gene 1 protein n=1 Tax=Oryctolagus cuniculus TaxID=9986 RepID=A0A5F9DSJ6_RABIT|nr:developmental pluripotency-associated 5 protein isoform X1 [Oryctolagus cuniculus]
MGTLPKRKDIPPWVKVPEDLKDPEVLQVQTRLLEAMFGPDGSRIPYIEQVSKAMLELKALESSDLTEVVVYGSYMYKLRTKWMLQSMAEWHRQRQERGVNGEMLAAFQRTCIVLLSIELDPLGGVLIFIYGRPFLQTLAMLLIVSASFQLRIRRNRARAWAKGLQGSVWASRRFI